MNKIKESEAKNQIIYENQSNRKTFFINRNGLTIYIKSVDFAN